MTKRIVNHPKLYLSVGGKLQKVAIGTEIDIDEKTVKRLGNKTIAKSQKTTEIGGKKK